MILRLARMADMDKILEFTSAIDGGMTSLPHDASAWESKLAINEASVHAAVPQPEGDIYLFLLEQDNKIVGTTAIYTGVGLTKPFYSYKVSTHVSKSDFLTKVVKTKILHLVNDFTGATELASLYLLPKFRAPNAGRFLSKSRFLMLHQFQERFDNTIFAELRGWVDSQGRSPFWEALGEKFFKMPFQRADFVSAVNGSQFISDLMPKYPVYMELLPETAQRVVGECNDNTRPAKRLLEQEGFQWKGYVDIFDAGPSMQCDIQHINILKKALKVKVAGTHNKPIDPTAQHYILSNGRLTDYRIALSPIEIQDDQAIIPEQVMRDLDLQLNDELDLLPMQTK
ncbi:MAG: arginine N-succinyltransferase [Gammaproteobacteria bacterium]|nr:arginine N-succinyltransferase [Gammaproteobacteria bacterium]HBF09020.1 arginine N-succinyltransferase [Gammaproteobacteria bacterium]|tara:strand:+ start:62 stop:1084 length:1023 start_codon:yes stop_codon:yes gene_type:complete